MTDVIVLPPASPNDDNQPQLPALSIQSLLSQAIQSNLSVDALERILAMRRELRAEEAKEAFDDAMRLFQAECPPIVKRRTVPTKTGAVGYQYAPFEDLVLQTQALRSKHGFSYSIETETLEKRVRARCIIRHIGGHEYRPEPYETALSAGTILMSNTQIIAAALTFATRYAFKNAFGLTVIGEDNETLLQRKRQMDVISEEELATLLDLLTQHNISQEEVIKRFKVDSLASLTKGMVAYITTKLTQHNTTQG